MIRRKLRLALLTAHVLSGVGWFGAVTTFLCLSIAAWMSTDPALVRSIYVTMGWADDRVLVPLALASLATGVIGSLTTRWGLFRHYWVVFKLVLTSAGTLVLLLYTQTLANLADAATRGSSVEDLRDPSPVIHAAGALGLLIATTVLAIYKPRGTTSFGRRDPNEHLTRLGWKRPDSK